MLLRIAATAAVVAGSNSLTSREISDNGSDSSNCKFVVTDAAGNASSQASTGTFYVDAGAPTMDNVTINDGDNETSSLSLSLTSTRSKMQD